MSDLSSIYLSVLSDDFGMCSAVNEGVVQAFTKGVLTDANIMAPCPAFDEAAQLAKTHKLPVGIHNTYTAEWDFYRWKPLTPLKSMVQPDGTFFTTVAEAWKNADIKEAEAEFEAQWAKVEAAGIKITHACEHMGAEEKFAGIFSRMLKRKKVPYRNFSLKGKDWDIPSYDWTSVFASSDKGTELAFRKQKLKDWIEGLQPGHHTWTVHCAVDHPSLEKMCAPNHRDVNWTRLYRILDQALVMDPEVKDWIAKRGIQLVSITHCPVTGWS
jgi:predicted glycoside hydrolase/deacetylase ChbG (UPF0249 family)